MPHACERNTWARVRRDEKGWEKGERGSMESERVYSCGRAEIAHRQVQRPDCEAPAPAHLRQSSARRTSKEGIDAERYRGLLAVLIDAIFYSADEISIEGLLEDQRRKGRHAMKNR